MTPGLTVKPAVIRADKDEVALAIGAAKDPAVGRRQIIIVSGRLKTAKETAAATWPETCKRGRLPGPAPESGSEASTRRTSSHGVPVVEEPLRGPIMGALGDEFRLQDCPPEGPQSLGRFAATA